MCWYDERLRTILNTASHVHVLLHCVLGGQRFCNLGHLSAIPAWFWVALATNGTFSILHSFPPESLTTIFPRRLGVAHERIARRCTLPILMVVPLWDYFSKAQSKSGHFSSTSSGPETPSPTTFSLSWSRRTRKGGLISVISSRCDWPDLKFSVFSAC